MLSKKDQILEFLKNKEKTIIEISQALGFKEDFVRTTVIRLKNPKTPLIREIGKKNKYIIYTTVGVETPIDAEILKKMIPEFIKNEITLETTTEKEDQRIMELIKECL